MFVDSTSKDSKQTPLLIDQGGDDAHYLHKFGLEPTST